MGIVSGSGDSSTSSGISEDEAALYDRQLRLWGIEAQKRLREAKILLIGLGGLGAEVAKNIALAGVKSITLLDDKKVGPADKFCQFLLAGAEDGDNRAEASKAAVKKLNPNVQVISDSTPILEKDASFFKQFKIVCTTNCPVDVLIKLDNICRENSVMFLAGDVWGFYGYCFVDLVSFTCLKDVKKSDTETVKQLETIDFVPLTKALACKRGKFGVGLPKKISKVFLLVHIINKFHEAYHRYPSPQHRDLDIENLKPICATVLQQLGYDESKVSKEDLSNVFGEVSPVCAVVGGVFAQEIIKAVGAVDLPYKNFFLFSGDDNVGTVESIG